VSVVTHVRAAAVRRWRALREDSLMRNSAMIAGASVATSGFGFVYWAVAAREYPAAEVGTASAAVAGMALVSTIAILGGQSLLVARLPRSGSARQWSATLTCTAVVGTSASLLGAAAFLVVVPLLDPGQSIVGGPVTTALFVVGVVATTVSTLTDFAWIAVRRASVMLSTNLVFSVGKLVVVAVLAGTAPTAESLLVSWSLTCVVATALSTAALVRWCGFRPTLRGFRTEVRQFSRAMLGHHAINLAVVAPTLFMPVLAASRLRAEDAAYLYAAWRIGGFFVLLASSCASALFAEGSHDAAGVVASARRGAGVVAAVLLSVMVVVVVFRGPVLGVFGPSYRAAASTALLLLALAAVPEAIVSLASAVFRVRGRLWLMASITGTVALAQLVAAWALMPHHGLTSAAAAALGAQTLGALAVLVCWRGVVRGPVPALVPGDTVLPAPAPPVRVTSEVDR
jgi:O-antigen/teichoic acid export membrane protein